MAVKPGRGPVFNDSDLPVAAALEGFGILYILEDLWWQPRLPMVVSSAFWSRGASRSPAITSITPTGGVRGPSNCSRRRFKEAGSYEGLAKYWGFPRNLFSIGSGPLAKHGAFPRGKVSTVATRPRGFRAMAASRHAR